MSEYLFFCVGGVAWISVAVTFIIKSFQGKAVVLVLVHNQAVSSELIMKQRFGREGWRDDVVR